MNDPQWLGMVPELLGLYVCVRWGSTIPALCGSALLFALAVFTKDNLIAVPVAVGANLLLMRDWKGLCVWAGCGLLVSGVLLAATVAIDGEFFFDHLLRARAASYVNGRSAIIGYALLFAPAIIVGAIWCSRHMRRGRTRLLALGWAAAHVLGIGLAFGNGVAYNILFEALVFDAIVVSVACRAMAGRGFQVGRAGLLLLNTVWAVALLPGRLSEGLHAREMLPRAEAAFTAGAELMRARSGPAWCEDLLMCHAAGKPMVFDAYFTEDQIETGRLPECEVLRQLVAQNPSAVEIGAPVDRSPPSTDARLRFTAGFMRTPLTYYAPVMRRFCARPVSPSWRPVTDLGRTAVPACSDARFGSSARDRAA